MTATLEERIRAHAPAKSFGYYLIKRKQGVSVRLPPEGAFRLNPFAPPSGAGFGTFLLYFVQYENDKYAMSPANTTADCVTIQISPPGKSHKERLLKDVEHIEETIENEAAPETNTNVETVGQIADLELAIASTPAMITARADFEKQRMAMELAENNQELLNKGNFSRDAAEALALNRAYRRESQVTIESQAHLVRRTAEEVQSHWVAFRTAQEAQIHGMRLLKEQIEMFARPAPPPPPTDYTPAIVEGLKTLRDFGVALIQAKSGAPATLPGGVPTELSQQSATARLVAEEREAPAAGAKDESSIANKSGVEPKSAGSASTADESTDPQTTESEPLLVDTKPDADSEMAAEWTELLAQWPDQDADVPAVKPVSAVASPKVSGVAPLINPAQSQSSREEAARLWRALAETSEIEAAVSIMGPEQLQAFLKRLRQRAARIDNKRAPVKK